MVDVQRKIINAALSLILVLYLQLRLLEAKQTTAECPIGFELAETSKDKICYSLKRSPEPFAAKFDGCTGNLFTMQLYNRLSLPKSESKIWTDYKSQFLGGLFIDWSYTKSMGKFLDTSYEVDYDPSLSLDGAQLCVVIDPVTNFTAVKCHDSYYRYCFVNAYSSDDSTSKEGCGDLTNGTRFFSPMHTCLSSFGGLRSTWNQSQGVCEKRGGSVLGRGWRYSNSFRPPGRPDLVMYPLNVIFNFDHTMLRYGAKNDSSEIPSTEWNFDSSTTNDTSLGAINNNGFWDMVNSSYVFYNVICERPIELRHVNLTVAVDSADQLITLTVHYTVDDKVSLDKDDIYCFTDSDLYVPQIVTKSRDSSKNHVYILKPKQNGYYWCTHKDSKNFYVSESNRALYVKVKDETYNLYAVKITTDSKYKLDKIGKKLDTWKIRIRDYVYYSNQFSKQNDMAAYHNYSILEYKNKGSQTGLGWQNRDIIQSFKLKRLYLDAETVLLHVELHPDMKPVQPGNWDDLKIEYMKPVYVCDKEKKLSLGTPLVTSDCKMYTCIGDYNHGVQTVISSQEGCTLPTPVRARTGYTVSDTTPFVPEAPPTPTPTTNTQPGLERNDSDSSEEWTTYTENTEVTTVTETSYDVSTVSNEVLTVNTPTLRPPTPPTVPPTTPTTTEVPTTETTPTTEPPPTTIPPPDEQLQQVIGTLEDLLNTEYPVLEDDIAVAFTEVNLLLKSEVNINGNLLNLLDEVGARIDLNGSENSTTVRDNIALVVADAHPDRPVTGLRVSARDSDEFTNDTFEIIRADIDNSQLLANDNEVVVSLPSSVANSSRRISFVVFRSGRTFASDHDLYQVNSRVLSIKVENLTQFIDGESIDIHLTPTNDTPDRNQSRVCAYWHINEDYTGYWSPDGCTFIRARENGLLDTCQCTHLTHFAEILVPRPVFSEENENALKIISIIGCIVSIVGLLLVGLTALLFRSWRRDYSNKIWLQLCIAIFFLSVCFLVTAFAPFEPYDVLCTLTGIALHYSVLASFCWMLVAAVLSYRKLVTVFTRDTSHKLLKASAFAWGVPCAVVGILLSIAPHSFSGRFEDKSPSAAFCYPSGLALWLGIYTPIAVMLLANWTLFILIVRSVFCTRSISRHGRGDNEALRCASVSCLLVFLFGLPWLFGLFAFNIVAAYLFTILATFQGLVLFMFFVLGNKKTRDLWLNKLRIKQTRKIPVTSSTYTNRSTAANVPSRGNQTPASIEANVSKPKSLSSSDNARFS